MNVSKKLFNNRVAVLATMHDSDLTTAEEFAQKLGFPTHGLVIWFETRTYAL